MSVNKCILVGNLGQDVELRYTQGGTAVANFSIATSEVWNDAQGKRQERTEWHRVVVWGKTAENCAQYLSKGRQVYVEGRLQTRKWQDKNNVTRYTTEVVSQAVRFLGRGSQQTSQQQAVSEEVPDATLPEVSEDAKQLLNTTNELF